SRILRSLKLALVLTYSDNRMYLASCIRHFAQIPRLAQNFRFAQLLGEIGQVDGAESVRVKPLVLSILMIT
ncbi:MAG: hypothetical protein QXZ17_11830, partial [Nitrososphaerota archaeon]